jgi:hypothetical protein
LNELISEINLSEKWNIVDKAQVNGVNSRCNYYIVV